MRKICPFSGLGTRFFILMLITLFSVADMMIHTFKEQQKAATVHAHMEAMQVVRMVASDHEMLIQETRQLLEMLARLPEVRNMDAADCHQLFTQFLTKQPHYTNIAMLNLKGDIISSALPFTSTFNVAGYAFFQLVLQTGRFSVGEYSIGYITRKPIIHFGYPVKGSDGQLKAILVAAVDLAWLEKKINKVDLPPGSTLSVLDRRGIILARFPDGDKWVGEYVPESTTMKAIRTKAGEGITEGPGLDGIPRFYAFKPLGDSHGVYISAGIPKEAVLSQVNHTIIHTYLELGLLLGVIFAGIWLIYHLFILRPVNSLVKMTQQLAAGNMSYRTGLTYKGEFGQLARAFDEMAAAIEMQQHKLLSLIDGLPGIVWLQKPDFTIHFANHNFRQFYGEPANRCCYEIMAGRTEPCENCPTAMVLETRSPFHWEQQFYGDRVYDIYERYFSVDGTPLVLKMGVDITEKKRTQEEMQRLDSLGLLGKMAAGIAHEVRNPLTTVRGFLQLMKGKEDSTKHKEYFQLMIDELDRANSIITEYLSLARKNKTELESNNLNTIIKDIEPLITADAIHMAKNIEVKLTDIPNLLLNRKEINQLILNLVRNGLEAMPEGGTLTVKTFKDGEQVVLAVKDQGPGIKPEVIKKLGTPFVTTKENGTGLGLAVCYGIANRHNATIDVETGPAGTTFNVRFSLS